MLLHTLNKSATASNALQSCLRSAQGGSSLLLFEDGVYAAIAGSDSAAAIAAAGLRCYVLAPDVAARGLQERIAEEFTTVDYADFVRLSTECHGVVSWY